MKNNSCLRPSSLGLRHPILSAFLLLLFALISLPATAKPQLTVGSKRFTESYVLGEVIKQTVQRAGEADAVHKKGLGNTGIVFAALKTGAIDVYPEYTGTIWQELLKQKGAPDMAAMNTQLQPLGLSVGVPLGFNDTYALAMRDDQAQKLGIVTTSDLAKHPELRVSLSHEFLTRADGWPGVKATYGMPFTPQGIDHGLAYAAIGGGQIDVTDIYSTDAQIEKYHLRVLKDDKSYFPAYDAVLIYRSDLPTRLPKSWSALQRLQNTIPGDQMVKLNAQAELKHMAFTDIAQDFLATQLKEGTVAKARSTSLLSTTFGGDFLKLTWEHLRLVFISLFFAILVGVPLGIWGARSRYAAGPILSIVGVLQTVPSLALLIFLIALVHAIGDLPALIALFLYALLPIVRNTYTGLTDITPALRESAQALGLSAGARLRLVELPLAARSILAGVKTSAVINVGTATLAALVGAGGYGQRIVEGLARNDQQTLLTGAIPAALLALLIQWLFDAADRWLVPAGLRERKAA